MSSIMNCPYCGGAMQKGFIQSKSQLAWQECEKLTYATGDCFSGVGLSKEWKPLKGFITEGMICRECRKVIIDYSK